jgi:hypothetical protein
MSATPDITAIWFTYKDRVYAEQRFRFYAVTGHLLITWYSFLLIILSVFEDKVNGYLHHDIVDTIAIILSILLFGASLIFYGFKFEEKAASFRECYLALQKITQGQASPATKMREYHKILAHYPNHHDRDHNRFVFERWQAGKTLRDAEGDIPVTWSLILGGYFRLISKWLAVTIAIAWPLIVAIVVAA